MADTYTIPEPDELEDLQPLQVLDLEEEEFFEPSSEEEEHKRKLFSAAANPYVNSFFPVLFIDVTSISDRPSPFLNRLIQRIDRV